MVNFLLSELQICPFLVILYSAIKQLFLASTVNFKNRHTFSDNKKRHKLAKLYGDRLSTLEQRGSSYGLYTYRWVGIEVLPFFEDILFTRTNCKGT